ncbi:multicopper oxidase domain-containing protein [Candidatus Methylacidithermus pantelleriae]|uniref:Putative Manganese oxidase n=1 Tax=Candidatus Methylacidithermus pantelleriae TaxID=2744239 RepID=A0A8J2FW21_9BACT|nr:multicopper oxidase domain-containing protein [Candidatus Methylacidithermus pantelleriae]CAF0696407.1 putative Manganese oxidase [Candidatus Methylacidithermus pantelleriae]
MGFSSLLLLGFVAGATIVVGMPVGRVPVLNRSLKAALSMAAVGILAFLLVEVLSESAEEAWRVAQARKGSWEGAAAFFFFCGGFGLGFLGLVCLEKWLFFASSYPGLVYLVAIGIGLHNLTEGLAIGQAYAQGMADLSLSLAVGFALHNGTEGFGIVGPAIARGQLLSWRTLAILAAIAGGPTFLGTLVGSVWQSQLFSILTLAMAGGTIFYVEKELLAGVRREPQQLLVMGALVAGFVMAWSTHWICRTAMGDRYEATEGQRVVVHSGPSLSPSEEKRQCQRVWEVTEGRGMVPQVLPDGTRRYELVAGVFPWKVAPGLVVEAWGYNRQVPGPLLRLRVGEKVEIQLKNELPEPTTLHLHGLPLPESEDGVPGISQEPVRPGEVYTYRFTVTPSMVGTHLYHTHFHDEFQMDQGLHGVLVVDPSTVDPAGWEEEFLYEIGSFKVGGSEEENLFTLNGKAFPDAPAVCVPLGAKVRMRLVNASARENHVMHLHGYTFRVVALDGSPLPQPFLANTVLLGPGQTADLAFVANNPGRWMFHCHILDHMTNPKVFPNPQSHRGMQDPFMGGLVSFVQVVLEKKDVFREYRASGSLMGERGKRGPGGR